MGGSLLFSGAAGEAAREGWQEYTHQSAKLPSSQKNTFATAITWLPLQHPTPHLQGRFADIPKLRLNHPRRSQVKRREGSGVDIARRLEPYHRTRSECLMQGREFCMHTKTKASLEILSLSPVRSSALLYISILPSSMGRTTACTSEPTPPPRSESNIRKHILFTY